MAFARTTTTRFGRRSSYNLRNANNYIRLAFKAASPDQDVAERRVQDIYSDCQDVAERVRLLARALLEALE